MNLCGENGPMEITIYCIKLENVLINLHVGVQFVNIFFLGSKETFLCLFYVRLSDLLQSILRSDMSWVH